MASTHSPDALDQFAIAEPDDAKLIALKKTEDDVLKYDELSLEELSSMIDKGLDVRKLLA